MVIEHRKIQVETFLLWLERLDKTESGQRDRLPACPPLSKE